MVGGGYHAINVITASPHEEFEKDFNYLQRRIETRFKGYKFVPISMCLRMIKGLHHDFLEYGTVYDALFNHLFNFYYFPLAHYRGDEWYWIRRKYQWNYNNLSTSATLTDARYAVQSGKKGSHKYAACVILRCILTPIRAKPTDKTVSVLYSNTFRKFVYIPVALLQTIPFAIFYLNNFMPLPMFCNGILSYTDQL